MTMRNSFKMYLSMFLATTCVYMILYQYHFSRAHLPTAQEIKSSELMNISRSTSRIQQNLSSSLSSLNLTSSKTTQMPVNPSINITTITIPTIKTTITTIKTTPSIATTATTTTTAITTATNTITSQANITSKKTLTTDLLPPPLYIITPTYKRPEQLAELTRLGYTLKHVVNLFWLVIEDSNRTSELVTKTLRHIGVPFEHLIAPMPEKYKKNKSKPRGVSNRNRGLKWLRENATDGVFYFADDDNTYDVSIFEQMRYTKKVSMWPVGLVTKLGVSSPIVRDGKIVGYYDGWIGGRKFPVDMAGFAVSVKFLLERPNAEMPFKPGYEEDGFLKSLAPFNNTEIELLASSCTEILTWHTQTKRNAIAEKINLMKYGNSNLVSLSKILIGS